MCRHAAYLGPPIPVGDLLTRGPHSLRTQSWAPREMRGGGTINADGFGVAWWTPTPPPAHGVTWHGGTRQDPTPPSPEPADAQANADLVSLVATRYRNAAPIWTDPAVDEVLPQIHSPAVLAAVRSATVGMPVELAACAPFTHGRWAFSHNGAIPDWRNALTGVAAQFDSPSFLDAESMTDSAVLWLILSGLLEGANPSTIEFSAGASSGAGATSTPEVESAAGSVPPHTRSVRTAMSFGSSASVTAVSGAEPEVTGGSLASATTDSSHGATRASGGRDTGTASRYAAQGMAPDVALRLVVRAVVERSPKARLNLLLGDGRTVWATTWQHSLSVLVADDFAVVASEPYDDDPRWRPIGDRQLVGVRPGWLSVEPLEIEIGRAS